MAISQILAFALFVGVLATLIRGFPVAFTLPGTALLFAVAGWAVGALDLSYFQSLPARYWGTITNDVLIAVSLFVFMGVMLERSTIAESLLVTMGQYGVAQDFPPW